ncbi:MAG: hypothetical protein ACRDMX_03660 [Solirubrobacteraceae bacterium]
MRPSCPKIVAVLCSAFVLLGAGPASAASSPQVKAILTQCANGPLTTHYPLTTLQQALRAMGPSQQQYTDCYTVIQQAITQARGHKGGAGGGSGGSFLPTWVIVIIVILILAAITVGAVAVRRRRGGQDGEDDGFQDGAGDSQHDDSSEGDGGGGGPPGPGAS